MGGGGGGGGGSEHYFLNLFCSPKLENRAGRKFAQCGGGGGWGVENLNIFTSRGGGGVRAPRAPLPGSTTDSAGPNEALY